ncbi:hypothetical protein [Frateuria aurantia]|uniref:Uncharacterized protein n=1 Tax=Frateuria aurantia (strain ATCC 33424 / DSM 6220 / KCTC 2777 / LMG 1558 / NBRC 3245 / NCIMB 13370) TaxID=767434 RepID=H8KZL7_FRAAD|nr:hypothetical protein [Frateuria aurantia]AFC87077.1 hypothetical protein Fraau_2735 [Frateuria aurantia DSM 6220]
MKLSFRLTSWLDWRRLRPARRATSLRPATLPRPRTLSASAGPVDLRGPASTLRKGRIADWYPASGSVISPDPGRLTR